MKFSVGLPMGSAHVTTRSHGGRHLRGWIASLPRFLNALCTCGLRASCDLAVSFANLAKLVLCTDSPESVEVARSQFPLSAGRFLWNGNSKIPESTGIHIRKENFNVSKKHISHPFWRLGQTKQFPLLFKCFERSRCGKIQHSLSDL